MITLYLSGFFAGGLSLLAPCVLPLLPLVIASSLRTSRWGPLLTMSGLVLSFTVLGVLTSAFGQVLDPEVFRKFGAVVLILISVTFLLPGFGAAVKERFAPIHERGVKLQSRLGPSARNEFLGGALLGMIWSPCSGPTLGLAIGLAGQAGGFWSASGVFFFFGIGAGVGLVSLGLLLRKFRFLTAKLFSTTRVLNPLVGGASMLFGFLILTGWDAKLEAVLLKILPPALIRWSSIL